MAHTLAHPQQTRRSFVRAQDIRLDPSFRITRLLHDCARARVDHLRAALLQIGFLDPIVMAIQLNLSRDLNRPAGVRL